MSLSISLLGSFQAMLDHQPATFATDGARALLAFLAVEADRPYRREALAGLLWPDQPDQRAHSNLSQTLVRLRRAIGDYQAQPPLLLITAKTIQFQATNVELDVVHFEALLAAAASHPHPELASCPACLARLQQALELYRGPFLQGLFLAHSHPFEEWRRLKQEQFQGQALQALYMLAEAYEQQELYEPAQAYAKRQLALEPWREEAHRQLMRLLALSGQRSAALAQYESCRQVLAQELAVEPAAETTTLYEQIRAGVLSKGAREQGGKGVEEQGSRGAGEQGSRGEMEQLAEMEISPLHPTSAAPLLLDWGEAPSLNTFYGRETELSQLAQWLTTDHCRLVAILGMGGIGKTLLAARAVKQVSPQFDAVIWRSLLNAPPLITLLPIWLQFLSQQQLERLPDHLDGQLQLLFDYLRRRRCLLILDNVETIMQPGSRAGQYRPGYEIYDQLIRRFGESEHQSCLLLTSRERPQGLVRLAGNTAPIRFLHLGGLAEAAGQALLQGQGLASPAKTLEELVEHYSGHPLALKLIAQTIQQLFAGDIETFLKQESVIFDDIRDILDQQVARLSGLERDIMVWLAIEREAVSAPVIRANLVKAAAGGAFLEALRSLLRRSLLEQQAEGFTLQNVLMEYTTDRLIETICLEFEEKSGIDADRPGSQADKLSPQPSTPLASLALNQYALTKAQAKEYVRQSQIRLILEPIARRLVANLGQPGIEARLRCLLDRLRSEAPKAPGYAAANILNLLLHLDYDVRGYDFSRLCIWQAYLRGLSLPEVNFSQTDLTGSVFTDIFHSIHAIAFSPDGRLLATGTGNGPIYLWQAANGQPVDALIGHTSFVWSIAFSPDGRFLASASEDHTVRLWDIQKRQTLHLLPGAEGWDWAVAFSPDGTTLATSQGDQIVRLWDVPTMQLRQTLRGHSSWVHCLAFSPDGRLIASGSHDRTVRLWDVHTGQAIQTLSGHSHRIRSVIFSPDGRLIASAGDDWTVRLWAVQTGQPVQILNGHSDRIFAAALSPDGTILASGGRDLTIRLWDTQTGQPRAILSGHAQDVRCLAFSPDGSTLASGSWDQTIRLWEVRTGQTRTILRGYNNLSRAIHFRANGRLLGGSIIDQTIRLWDVRSGRTDQILRGHIIGIYCLVFSPDGAMVASSGWDQTVRLWDVRSGRAIQAMRGHTNVVTNLAFSPNGELVASSSTDRTTRVWHVRTGQLIQTLSGHSEEVRAVAFSPDGLTLVSAGADRTVRVWNVYSGQLRSTLSGHSHIVSSLAFSPKGDLVASGSYDWTIRIWDIHSGQLRRILSGHTSTVNPLSFNPDGTLLASGSDDRTVRIWEISTGHLRYILHGHTNWVRTLAFSPDGATLASSSDDETIKLWDVGSGLCLDTFRAEGPYAGLNITGATGLTEVQKAALKTLGAIEQAETD